MRIEIVALVFMLLAFVLGYNMGFDDAFQAYRPPVCQETPYGP